LDRESDEAEIAFPPTLTNVERMFLHNLAKELVKPGNH
jgi:hypothetical protein